MPNLQNDGLEVMVGAPRIVLADQKPIWTICTPRQGRVRSCPHLKFGFPVQHADGFEDAQDLPHLQCWLAGFRIDDETHTDARSAREFARTNLRR